MVLLLFVLLQHIILKNDSSYTYVTHEAQYGFATHKKEKKDKPIVEESEYIFAYIKAISDWRRNFKLHDDQDILGFICIV